MQRYKVTVEKLKPNKSKGDDIVKIQEGDVFFGWSRNNLIVGKHFDLWFTPRISDDQTNFVGFARITDIVESRFLGVYPVFDKVKTKFAQLKVERLEECNQKFKTTSFH